MESFQDRINRMHAWQDERRREEEKFKKNQEIRLFINNCDEIRQEFRDRLQRDSKLCQLEQIKEKEIQRKTTKDIENAWSDIQLQIVKDRTMKEEFVMKSRWQEGLEIQQFQKEQMLNKREASMKIYDEFNDENKLIAKIFQEDQQAEIDRKREKEKVRKIIDQDLRNQIENNEKLKKHKIEEDLKLEKELNLKIQKELELDAERRKVECENFRQSVFDYLESFIETRRHHEQIEREKEKLNEEIMRKFNEEQIKNQKEFYKKRKVVNEVARLGQLQQIYEQKQNVLEELTKIKAENFKFNERENFERQKIIEENYQKRLQAYHYGCELKEQKKSEELRNLAEKQKLEETLMLAEKERERHETMGREFAKSLQDVLPLHPNLLIMQKGFKYTY